MSRFSSKPVKDENFLNLSDLKLRGWSTTMIEKILGLPDKTEKNPRYRKSPPICLYTVERVRENEETPRFLALQKKAKVRSDAMKRSSSIRVEALLESVEKMTITLAPLPYEDLLPKTQELWKYRHNQGRAEQQSDSESDAAFQRRIMVNYARHQLTKYDTALDETAERVGAIAARERIRQRIYDEIAKAYPSLASECRRQMNKRGVTLTETTKSTKIKEKITSKEKLIAKTKVGIVAFALLDGF